MDEATFLRAIDAAPEQFATYFIFADWLEERGDFRAAGFRWMAENKKCPYYWRATDTWDWWNFDGAPNKETVPLHCIIPGRIFQLLRMTERRQFHRWIGFDSRNQAMSEFCVAINKFHEKIAAYENVPGAAPAHGA